MPTRITVNNNGSYRVEGNIELCDAAGNKFDLAGRTTISLCRCGRSKNKPFCDGTHKEGFESVVVARVLEPPKPKPA
jgi:CDGSH-type Zn-finger protein